MRFLADESCDFGVVRALRAAGHDVSAVADIVPRAEDSAVIALALREERIVLSEDKDFGRLVFAEGQPSAGVILIRFSARARRRLPEAIVEFVRQHGVAPTRLDGRSRGTHFYSETSDALRRGLFSLLTE